MTGRPRVLAGATTDLFAAVDEGAVTIGSFGDRPGLRTDGALAEDLARLLAGGRLGGDGAARLAALGAALGPEARALVDDLRAETFVPASAARVIRRSGFGTLFVELTARCNAFCTHCYASAGPERDGSLPVGTALAAIEDAARLGFARVQLTGGDPLLREALPEVAAAGVAAGLAVEVFTNGIALGDALLARLPGVSFAFSLYGDRAAVHEAVTRTPGSFAATTAAIARARDAGRRVRVAVIVERANRHEAGAALALAQRLAGDAGAARLGASRAVGRGGYEAANETVVRAAPGGEPPEEAAVATRPTGKACVTADGTVLPCIFARGRPLGRVGEGRRLAEVLAHPRAGEPAERYDPDALAPRLACRECQETAALLACLGADA